MTKDATIKAQPYAFNPSSKIANWKKNTMTTIKNAIQYKYAVPFNGNKYCNVEPEFKKSLY